MLWLWSISQPLHPPPSLIHQGPLTLLGRSSLRFIPSHMVISMIPYPLHSAVCGERGCLQPQLIPEGMKRGWDPAGQALADGHFPALAVAHHDLENTLNCSFIEPPSVVEQPSPSWSSRGSFSSFDTTDEGPVYCVPHEGETPAWCFPGCCMQG